MSLTLGLGNLPLPTQAENETSEHEIPVNEPEFYGPPPINYPAPGVQLLEQGEKYATNLDATNVAMLAAAQQMIRKEMQAFKQELLGPQQPPSQEQMAQAVQNMVQPLAISVELQAARAALNETGKTISAGDWAMASLQAAPAFASIAAMLMQFGQQMQAQVQRQRGNPSPPTYKKSAEGWS